MVLTRLIAIGARQIAINVKKALLNVIRVQLKWKKQVFKSIKTLLKLFCDFQELKT